MWALLQLTQPSFVAVSHRTAGSPLCSSHGVSRCIAVAKEAALPRDIKEVVSQMRASVQDALQSRVSRIDVDLPIGAEFGVEQGGEKRKRGAKLTAEDVARSDRELVRRFVKACTTRGRHMKFLRPGMCLGNRIGLSAVWRP